MDIALQTVEYLANEDNYVPYSAALDELGYVDDMLERTELYGAFSVSTQKIVFLCQKLHEASFH